MSAEIGVVFTEILFGSGAWIGLILLLTISLAMVLRWKATAVLFMPITLLLGIEYLTYELTFHAMILFFTTIFMVLYMVREMR